ncbi:hypothetical protein X798_03881 [Onchocerca flexuosa]|uniref:Uncharacterized protein n=1 Tax=Onchocerca flexuosa TaxID=387005 RepID=A0A238BVZ1_9BILA|nr:hypothetical protein X798_03881 [Onchocerca flexuosa]
MGQQQSAFVVEIASPRLGSFQAIRVFKKKPWKEKKRVKKKYDKYRRKKYNIIEPKQMERQQE